MSNDAKHTPMKLKVRVRSGFSGRTGENCEAVLVARLAQAVPDLLSACKRAIAALAANGAPNCEAAKECRAAIAKAEGPHEAPILPSKE